MKSGVGWEGLEPSTNALKGRCSTIELPTRCRRAGEIRGAVINAHAASAQASKTAIAMRIAPSQPAAWLALGNSARLRSETLLKNRRASCILIGCAKEENRPHGLCGARPAESGFWHLRLVRAPSCAGGPAGSSASSLPSRGWRMSITFSSRPGRMRTCWRRGRTWWRRRMSAPSPRRCKCRSVFRSLDHQRQFDALLLSGDPTTYKPLLKHLAETQGLRPHVAG